MATEEPYAKEVEAALEALNALPLHVAFMTTIRYAAMVAHALKVPKHSWEVTATSAYVVAQQNAPPHLRKV